MTTEELCSYVRVTIGHLPNQGPSPPIAQFGRAGRALVVPNIYHLRMMEATVFLGTFNAAEILRTIHMTSMLSFPHMHCQLWDLI